MNAADHRNEFPLFEMLGENNSYDVEHSTVTYLNFEAVSDIPVEYKSFNLNYETYHFVKMKRSAQNIIQELRPVKSAKRYDTAWKDFIEYSKLDDQIPSEEHFIEYFDHLRNTKQYASSTMWSVYSMLNTNFQLMSGKKLQIFPRLQILLKSYEAGYKRKTANVFTKAQIDQFLENAPDIGEFVHIKAAVVLCYFGGLRCADLVNIETDNFEFSETTGMWVTYVISKQRGESINNRFNVPLNYCQYLEKYDHELARCGKSDGRLMKTFRKNKQGDGYYTSQPMGIHLLRKMTIKVAEFLKLPDAERYTGHALRRSSANSLAEAGVSTTLMKKHFNWKSEATALKYVDNTNESKIAISKAFESTGPHNEGKNCNEAKILNLTNCQNVVINF